MAPAKKTTSLHPVMWAVILIGAVLTISVTYLLQIERKVQVTLTAFFAMFIGWSSSSSPAWINH